MALLEIETVFICNASRYGFKVIILTFTHQGNSKPTAVSLLRLKVFGIFWQAIWDFWSTRTWQPRIVYVLGLGA